MDETVKKENLLRNTIIGVVVGVLIMAAIIGIFAAEKTKNDLRF